MNRVQRKRTKGSKLPPNTKCVDRSSEHGNPYRVCEYEGYWTVYGPGHDPNYSDPASFISPLFETKAEAAAVACVMFEAYVWQRLSDFPDWLENLRGHNLACWCPESQPCHADVLLRILSQYNPGMDGDA